MPRSMYTNIQNDRYAITRLALLWNCWHVQISNTIGQMMEDEQTVEFTVVKSSTQFSRSLSYKWAEEVN